MEENKDLKQRLLEFIEFLGLNPYSFERKIGISEGVIRKAGRTISKATEEKIKAAYPELNINWLVTGEGEMLKEAIKTKQTTEDNAVKSENNYLFSDHKFREDALPLIPVTAIGGKLLDNNFPVRLEDCDWLVIPQFKGSGAKYLIRVSGDSMSPLYPDGTLLAIKDVVSAETIHWGEAYVLNTIDGSVIKRLQPYEKDEENYFLCVSEDKERYPAFKIHRREVISIFQVVGSIIIKF